MNKEIKKCDVLWKNNNKWEYDLEKLKKYVFTESKKHSKIKDLCDELGVYRDFFRNIEKKYDFKFNYDFKITKNNSKFKAIYQDYDWCYRKYIVEGLNHEEIAKEADCNVRVLKKWLVEKHRLTQEYRMINKPLSDVQKKLIIGSLLGDGHIDKREDDPVFIVCHSNKQKDYLFWKYNILKDLCNIPPTCKKGGTQLVNEQECNVQDSYRVSTRVQYSLKEYRALNKRQIIDKLDDFSLAVFSLDDWTREGSCWNLCLAGLQLDDRKYLINILYDKFGLVAKMNNYDNRYATMDAISSRKLDEIIKANIPNDLDIVKHKILNNKINKAQYRIKISENGKEVYLSDFCKEKCLNYKQIYSFYKKYNFKSAEEILSFIKEGE